MISSLQQAKDFAAKLGEEEVDVEKLNSTIDGVKSNTHRRWSTVQHQQEQNGGKDQ